LANFDFFAKFRFFCQISIFCEHFDFSFAKFQFFFCQISIFCQIFDFSQFWFVCQIYIFWQFRFFLPKFRFLFAKFRFVSKEIKIQVMDEMIKRKNLTPVSDRKHLPVPMFPAPKNTERRYSSSSSNGSEPRHKTTPKKPRRKNSPILPKHDSLNVPKNGSPILTSFISFYKMRYTVFQNGNNTNDIYFLI